MDNIKIGDKVLVKAEIVGIKENFPCGKYEVSVASFDYKMLSKQRIYVNDVLTKSYEDGLNDSWKLAKKITCNIENGGLNTSELEQIFGYGDFDDVLANYTPQEAAAKIAKWDDTKEICVGDVVKTTVCEFDGVVSKIKEEVCYVIFGDGFSRKFRKNDLIKTGRSIDIAGLLEQIGDGCNA